MPSPGEEAAGELLHARGAVAASARVVLVVLLTVAFSPTLRAQSSDIVAAARRQIGLTVHYDGSYRKLTYPGGDVPPDRGVCTDVVIRALRAARNLDLQEEIHRDARANPGAYRRAVRPDANIDHRRVPNQMTWFARRGYSLELSQSAASYLPGDIVAWDLGGGILHIGIVSEATNREHVPLIVHNIGRGVREEDLLFSYRIIGHYRLAASAERSAGAAMHASRASGARRSQPALQHRGKLGIGEGLAEKVVHSCRGTSIAVFRHDTRRERDDRHAQALVPLALAYPARCGEAIHTGHVHVHQDEVERLALEQGERISAIFGDGGRTAAPL